jgi:uncharacterized protein (DUF1810 family)
MFEHFVTAQDRVYAEVLSELLAGDKASHWMWFIFPQLTALGRSETARRFGIANLDEARAYLRHPVLGPRLLECTGIVNRVEGRTAHEIFHSPDDLKFRSSMTLFDRAAEDATPFRRALDRYYDGVEDPLTVAELER